MNRGEYIKTRIRARGQVTLPNEVRKFLRVEAGDDLVFILDENGRVVVDRARIIPPEQAWFWTDRWQAMERTAQADIDAGRVSAAKSADKAIAELEVFANARDRENPDVR